MFDERIFEVQPRKPLKIVIPGMKIEAGDVLRLLDRDDWLPISDFEIGNKAPRHTIAYARLELPDMYRRAKPNEIVSDDDLFWDNKEGSWLPWRTRELRPTGTVAKIKECIGQELYFVKIDENNPDSRTVPLPKNHRLLQPGELLRHGDSVIYSGLREWFEIPSTTCGYDVQETTESNGYGRSSRPMGEDSFVVYVGRGQELDESTGESVVVYPSLQNAKQALEFYAARAARPPVGVVLTTCGKQLYASDPTEPLGQSAIERSGACSE